MRSAGSYAKDGVGQTDTLERDAPMAYPRSCAAQRVAFLSSCALRSDNTSVDPTDARHVRSMKSSAFGHLHFERDQMSADQARPGSGRSGGNRAHVPDSPSYFAACHLRREWVLLAAPWLHGRVAA